MLIFTDEQRERAGIKSLSKRCSHCRKPLLAYPLIVSDDAVFGVYHAACAAALATDILVDLYTFFRPPTPYHQLFVRLFSNIGHQGQSLRFCFFKAQPHTKSGDLGLKRNLILS